MVNAEFKNSPASNLNNPSSSSSSSSPSSTSSTLRDIPREVPKMADKLTEKVSDKVNEKFGNDATPRMREKFDQVTGAASNLYGKASGWIQEGNNRNYGFVALAATAGVIGFFVGRGFRAKSTEF